MIPIYIPIILFFIPLIVFRIRYGQTRSVSAIFYELPEENRKLIWVLWQWSFSIAMFLAIPSSLTFGAAGFICFSAAAGDTKSSEITEKVHIGGAFGGIALAMGEIIRAKTIEAFIIVGLYVVMVLYGHLKSVKNHTYWVEVMAVIFLIGHDKIF